MSKVYVYYLCRPPVINVEKALQTSITWINTLKSILKSNILAVKNWNAKHATEHFLTKKRWARMCANTISAIFAMSSFWGREIWDYTNGRTKGRWYTPANCASLCFWIRKEDGSIFEIIIQTTKRNIDVRFVIKDFLWR